jgi:hypothetical protein
MNGMGTSAFGDDEEDLRRFFTLTLDDLRFVAGVRADPISIPAPIIACVCKQLGLKPMLLSRLPMNSSSARTATYEAVCDHLKLRRWSDEDTEQLRAQLKMMVAQTGNTAALLNAADDWIAHQEVLRPAGETTIERLVYEARYAAEEALYEQVVSQLAPEDCTLYE